MNRTDNNRIGAALLPPVLMLLAALLGSGAFFVLRQDARRGDPQAFQYAVWVLCLATLIAGLSAVAALWPRLLPGPGRKPQPHTRQPHWFTRHGWLVCALLLCFGLLIHSWLTVARETTPAAKPRYFPEQLFVSGLTVGPVRAVDVETMGYLVTAKLHNQSGRIQHGTMILRGRDRNKFSIYLQEHEELLELEPGERTVALEFNVPKTRMREITDWSAVLKSRAAPAP